MRDTFSHDRDPWASPPPEWTPPDKQVETPWVLYLTFVVIIAVIAVAIMQGMPYVWVAVLGGALIAGACLANSEAFAVAMAFADRDRKEKP